MEIFELRYFAAVAQAENVNRAAETINVSPGSLSKAVSRLEDELQTPLFYRSGRGIRLTPEGLVLKQKAAQLLQMEADIRTEIAGSPAGAPNLFLSSEEILQSYFLPAVSRRLLKMYPQARVHGLVRGEAAALEQVRNGEAQLAMITREAPRDLKSQTLARISFRTCVGRSHSLAKLAKRVSVTTVLEHSFVLPSSSWLGHITKSTSPDGWRDDKYPRRVGFQVGGLKLAESLIRDGLAVGYLPEYFVEQAGLIPLNITDCPYSCEQTIRLVAKEPETLGWLGRLWDGLLSEKSLY